MTPEFGEFSAFHRKKLVLVLNDNVVNIVYNCQVFFNKYITLFSLAISSPQCKYIAK